MATLQGTANADTLTGTAAADSLTGLAGADSLTSLGGADTLEGGAGADTLSGGAGTDRLSYASSDVGVSVNLATGAVSGGHAQGDTLADANATLAGFQSDFEEVLGSVGADTLTGGSGNAWLHGGTAWWNGISPIGNSLTGGGGNDTLTGGAGDTHDTLIGGAGDDSLVSFHGGDLLEGGDDNDTLIGGSTYGPNTYGPNNTLKGGAGDDSLVGGPTADRGQASVHRTVGRSGRRHRAGMKTPAHRRKPPAHRGPWRSLA